MSGGRPTLRSGRRSLTWRAIGGLGLVLFALGACAEVELVSHAVKSTQPEPDRVVSSEPVPEGYKVGKPYQVAGVWYYPSYDRVYVESGLASWYGPKFHGRPTANGEVFDMNAMTAAHQTLPLPSRVRVTNLENGRAVVLRVNDRGPFINGRIIDVSRRGAQLLGFHRAGTAKVRVEFLGLDSLNPGTMIASASSAPLEAPAPRVAERPPMKATPAPEVVSAPLDEPVALEGGSGGGLMAAHAAAPPEPLVAPAGTPQIFVQVGAFRNRDLALRLGGRVGTLGRVVIAPIRIDDRPLYRVRLGPLAQVDEADQILARLIRAGFSDSRIIVERTR